MKKNTMINWALLAGAIVVVLVGLWLALGHKGAPRERREAVPSTYALADVRTASTTDKCWVAIKDGVYDLTPFARDDARVATLCGTDATQAVAQLGSASENNFSSLRIGTLASQ